MLLLGINRIFSQERSNRLTEIDKTFLFFIVVEEVIITTDKGFVDTSPKVFKGLEAIFLEAKRQVGMLSSLFLQDIIAALGLSIDIVLVAELEQGPLDGILTAGILTG